MIRIMCFLISLLASITVLAGNFSITPLGSLPSRIRPGDTVQVKFLVKNLTQSTRSGYVLSQLPANVQQVFSSSFCSAPLSLKAEESCVLAFNITGPVTFDFSLCAGASCTTASASIALATQTIDSTFPYGAATSGNVCTSIDEFATPETMLGSWAMLEAVDLSIASGELTSTFSNTYFRSC